MNGSNAARLRSTSSSLLSLVSGLLAVTLAGCVATLGELDDESSSTSTADLVATRVALQFEVGGFRCPPGAAVCPASSEQCLCQPEQDHLDAVRVMPSGAIEGHYMVMGSDARRGEIEAMGNRLAVNINELNADWETGAVARANAMMAWAERQFPDGVPQWFLLNEISRGAWTDSSERGARYRRYVGEVARQLSEVHGRRVVVFSPFWRPGFDGRYLHREAWQTIARHAYIGVENYLSGENIRAHGFSESYCRAHYQASLTAYGALGVARNRLMLTEHFGQTRPGITWGRSGVPLHDWLRAIRVRTRAQRSLPVAGFVGYAWSWNTDGRPSSDRIAAIDAYLGVGARRLSRPVAIPRGSGDAGSGGFVAGAGEEPEHAPEADDGSSPPIEEPLPPAEGEPAADPMEAPITEPPSDPGDAPPEAPGEPDDSPYEPPSTPSPPPAMCAPRTCGGAYNDYCEGALDGCGGVLSCGDTCGAGLNCSPNGVCRRALAQPCAGPGQCASNRCNWTTSPGTAARCCHDAGQWCDSDLKCCGSLVCRSGRCATG